jgi:transcriptional regulator NrdR family protein
VFTTHEGVDLSSALLVDSGASIKPFLTDMLFTEVLLALQDRKDCYLAAREVTNTVIKQLLKLPDKPLYKPHQISLAAGAVLKRLDKRAWLRYAAEHPSLQA